MQNTVYKGSLPADTSGKADNAGAKAQGVPTVAQIQSEISRLIKHVDVGGMATSNPGDVAGRAAYSLSVSPKHSGGLLGRAQLAWDAMTGVPLRFAIYARGNPTPVLALTATNISYGAISPSDLAISPPSGRQSGQGLHGRQARRGSGYGAGHPQGGAHATSAASLRWPPMCRSRSRRPSQLAGLPRRGRHPPELGWQAGRAGHLRPGPRRDRGDRAE